MRTKCRGRNVEDEMSRTIGEDVEVVEVPVSSHHSDDMSQGLTSLSECSLAVMH